MHSIFQDSFVVSSDDDEEEEDSDCTEYSNDDASDLGEITIAPTRPNKRKSDETKASKSKKRRRIIELSSDSD